jgi:acetyl/propionyl-CoA carboxylase alpha subunit
MFQKLLIANRGEIAVRILRAAREMGIRTVAVASGPDRNAMHARLADEVVPLEGASSGETYLDIQKILDAARATGAEAIHPGYGFLSERAEFAEACERAGIAFVGPPAEAMRALGAKIAAKQLAVKCGVPVTPGFFEPGADEKSLAQAASRIGFPVMLKASAGGGGRGMRVVRRPEDFPSELAIARDEARAGFGDDAMMVEKLIERPRHVEVQMLADAFGGVAPLFERECSLQRRHQKLIEESPAPLPTLPFAEEIWPKMREACRKLLLAAGYRNAGTVEFMVDDSTGEFFFLEVNARLQVEHPVTEAVTGLDLVQLQLRIAAGERLNLPNELLEGSREALRGHAIECRIVAEDPEKGFLPSSGRLFAWAEPKGPGIRVDAGYGPGGEVSRHYDSLLAKVIVHARDRTQAIARMEAALLDFPILGVATNVGFLLQLLGREEFREGRFDTGFLDRELPSWPKEEELPPALGAILPFAGVGGAPAEGERRPGVWDAADAFRNTAV